MQNNEHAKELTVKHLSELRTSFNKILNERSLPKIDFEEHLRIYHHFRDIILATRSDAQITLYGSLSFECCLKDTTNIDIDIQFDQTSPYETLKQLLEIVRSSNYYKNAYINIEHEPLSIDLSILNSNILVRLTSNNTRAIQLSEMVQIYTKFDKRVLPLLRLFRILSKTCNLDRPDIGTLHPIVFHFMVIHFLQQLDSPVLPCLHEYVFGIDNAPVTITNDQYANFFQICEEYVVRWKSKNTTNIEMIFLQLLSYYVQQFSITQLIVSIQTRMPLFKNGKQINNRKLFCADPTSPNRNLSYTIKSTSSFKYFQDTLRTALNYFCQRHKNENISLKQILDKVNKSYTLFIYRFPDNIPYWTHMQQEEVRQYYKQTFDNIHNPLPEPILKLNENNISQLLPDNDDDYQNKDDQFIKTDKNQNEFQLIDQERQNRREEPILFETLATNLNENQKEILRQEYDQQVKIFNTKIQQILNDIKFPIIETLHDQSDTDSLKNSIVSTTSIIPDSSCNYPEYFYDMQPKNFNANKGPPSVCTICYRNNHVKSNCPELSLPNVVGLSNITREWIHLISCICQQVTGQYKANREDIEKREIIIKYLQIIFEKNYPTCCVYGYGSSHNGFGLRQSDLDICVLLKDNNNQSNLIILETFYQIMKTNSHAFKNIELVRDARIPIIRSINSQFNIEIDISLHNILAMENTRLLKTYTEIDSRVSELGYMIKYLIKVCDIGDASNGTLSSYAYIIMLIHFLQRICPPVLPVLQQLTDDPLNKNGMIRECDKWNVYFYDNLSNLKQVWMNNNGPNILPTGQLWMEFLRYYTEIFDYKNNVVTIRQFESLKRYEKGWFHQTIAIEDPFILTHNLAEKLSLRKWTLIRRVFIRARQQFCLPLPNIYIHPLNINHIQKYLFDINILCPENVDKLNKSMQNLGVKQSQNYEIPKPLMGIRINSNGQRQ